MATTIKAGDSFELWPSSETTTAIVPVSDQKLTVIAYCLGSSGADVKADSAYASGGMGAFESATITGISANMQLRCYPESAGVVWDSDESSGYPRGRGDGGKAARLELYNGVSYVPIFIAGGGGGGQLNRNATNSAWDISPGHDSGSGDSWQNPDGNGTTLTAGRSSVNTQGFEISFDWSDSGNVNGSGDGLVRVYVTSVLNYAPYITSFTSPATISTGNNIVVNWTGVQDIVNGTLTFDLDYTTDGGTTWTSLLASSTLTTYSLATPLISGSKTYQFRVRAKNSGYTGAYSYSTTILTGNLKPDDANSVALLHFDITQDETGKIMIPYGGAQTGPSGLILDGVDDYVQVVSSAFNSISTNWRLHLKVYLNAYATNGRTLVHLNTDASGSQGVHCWVTTTGALVLDNGITGQTGVGTVPLNALTDVVVENVNGTNNLYINGSLVGSNTASSFGTLRQMRIGSFYNSVTSKTAGYISMVELSIGGITVFLSHFDTPLKTGLEDESGKTWTAYGGATTSAAAAKFGSGGLVLDGIDDYLALTEPLSFPGSIFTIESNIYIPSGTTGTRCIISGTGINVHYNSDAATSSGYIYLNNGLTYYINTTVCPVDQFFHLAVVGDVTNDYIFINGVLSAVGNKGQTFSSLSNIKIGANATGASSFFKGYMDEGRISNVARYTANFTPPSMPFGSSLQGFYRYII